MRIEVQHGAGSVAVYHGADHPVRVGDALVVSSLTGGRQIASHAFEAWKPRLDRAPGYAKRPEGWRVDDGPWRWAEPARKKERRARAEERRNAEPEAL